MNQVTFAQPNQRVRLGTKKFLELKRGQDFIEGLAWFSVIAVTAMFLIDGGLKTLSEPVAILGAVDRLTALLATNLLLIDILLIARIPWIDHYYGHDRATAAHKKLGKPILYLVLAHFAASVIQYAMVENVDVITEFISLLSIGDLLLATGALVLMILVVVTSLNFARKAVTYEAWYLVHIFAYGAVLLAIPHQFSTGSDIAGKPIALTYWISFYLFVLVNVVWYRILRPVVRGLRHSLRVSNVVRESSDAVSIYLSGKNVEKLGGAAGQFYLVRVLTARDWWRPHPFSISAAPNNKFVRFTVADRGDDTKLMQALKPGTPIMLEGPYGVFTEERRTREKVVLVAAGIGIPPIRALAEEMAARPHDVTIIYRLRNQEDAALLTETRALAAQRGFRLIELEGRRGIGTSWMNADFSGRTDLERLKALVPDIAESDVYVCGPTAWTRAVEKTMKAAGVAERQIHAEEFAW
jgi:predicted ferric reductase